MTMWRCLLSSALARVVLADPAVLRRGAAILLQVVAVPVVLVLEGPEARVDSVLRLSRSHQSRSA